MNIPQPNPAASAVVDAHAHFWDPALLRYEWLDDVPVLNRPQLPSDVATATSPSFVFVQADARADQALQEARWVHDLAEKGTRIAAVVAFAPLEQGASVRPHLDALSELPLVVGVRRLLQSENEHFFRDSGFHEGLDALEASGLTFDACVRHHQLALLVEVIQRHPGLSVVLDHLGKPPVAEGLASEDGERWLQNMRRLAAMPNVVVKLSGLPAEVPGGEYPLSALRPWLEEALDAFGSARSMYGSDWPVSANSSSAMDYDEWREMVVDVTGAGDSARDDVTWRTASTFYGLGLGGRR